jgi:hypothetical protein
LYFASSTLSISVRVSLSVLLTLVLAVSFHHAQLTILLLLTTVLEPYHGRVAYVPDLGEDDIKQYHYDEKTGTLSPTCTISCGPSDLKPHGA